MNPWLKFMQYPINVKVRCLAASDIALSWVLHKHNHLLKILLKALSKPVFVNHKIKQVLKLHEGKPAIVDQLCLAVYKNI